MTAAFDQICQFILKNFMRQTKRSGSKPIANTGQHIHLKERVGIYFLRRIVMDF